MAGRIAVDRNEGGPERQLDFEVTARHDRQRADRVVTAFCQELSRSQVQRLFAEGVLRDENDLVHE